MCIAVCPVKAIKIPWGDRTSEKLQENISDYAKAVLSLFDNVVYFNALINVTKKCDCISHSQTPLIDDIGYLFSKDMVSIDQASVDLIKEQDASAFSDEINSFTHQLDYAERVGLGSKDHDLIQL